jgi:hypothetical protein
MSKLWIRLGDRIIETVEGFGPVSEEQSMELYYFLDKWTKEVLKQDIEVK